MKKILIVEDDGVTALAYRGCLQRAGFAVYVVGNGQAALDCLGEVAPDALLLDLMMPEMDGIHFLKALRALPEWEKTPVMVYTNAFIPAMIQQAEKAGATKVFNKQTLTVDEVTTAFRGALDFPGP